MYFKDAKDGLFVWDYIYGNGTIKMVSKKHVHVKFPGQSAGILFKKDGRLRGQIRGRQRLYYANDVPNYFVLNIEKFKAEKHLEYITNSGELRKAEVALKDTVYSMRLHDRLMIDKNTLVLRVPGGWIYHILDGNQNTFNDVFVPFHNEFQ